jgi:hypothetical protein
MTIIRKSNIIFKKAIWRLKDNVVQWLWFVFNVQRNRIGFDKGLLTWQRESSHKKLKRKVHICLMEVYPKEGKFGRFTAFWINERSRICSISLNERIEDADVLWIYSQDPLPAGSKKELLEALKKSKPGTPVINHPDIYNSYHEEYVFKALEKAGVSVPRSTFTEDDIGKTRVVYKVKGKHGSSKFISFYRGPIEGFRPFEFVDSRGPEGLYRKYRAFHILGIVCPNHIAFSDQWNVHRETKQRTEYVFDMPPLEIESIHEIAKVLNIQYFSVDYLRRSLDNFPVFTDINVYPLPIDFTETAREFGYFGRWHILDNRLRLGIRDPSGSSFWEMFDEAILAFTARKDMRSPKEIYGGRERKY